MREIKFRQKLKESLCFGGESFHYWGFIDDCFISPLGKNDADWGSEQYGGLKDCNGVEIYEGDIVYIGGYGSHDVGFPFSELYDAVMENDIGEIMGSIHENPDLLE